MLDESIKKEPQASQFTYGSCMETPNFHSVKCLEK